jgi:hypothetical protein
LTDANGRSPWPDRGVYFFFEDGEFREDGRSLRVVRIGTHAITESSRTRLWTRLSQHRGHEGGRYAGGGNHRGSIFRLLVGEALLNGETFGSEVVSSWGKGSSASATVRDLELSLERAVSERIRSMPLLWIDIGRLEDRKMIERNSIALLGNKGRDPIDAPSPSWVGRLSPRQAVRESGLWNIRHVEEMWDPAFLEALDRCALKTS